MTNLRHKIASLFSIVLVILLIAPVTAFAQEPDEDALATLGDVAINQVNFPDPNFFWWVNEQSWAKDDGILSQSEAASITMINVNRVGVGDLTGIEFFPELVTLACSDNYITHIDTSHNPKLEQLWCDNYVPGSWPWNLVSINVTQNPRLNYLSCSGQSLTSIDLSGNPMLENLELYDNQFESIDLSGNPALKYLNLNENKLTSIDLSGNPVLRNLSIHDNQLTSLDVSNNKELGGLHCAGNELTNLDLSQNSELFELSCSDNHLTTLDLSANRKLYPSLYVVMYVNQTSTADVFSPDGGVTNYVDLETVVGLVGIANITSVTGGSFDTGTRLVKLDSPLPSNLTYTYNVHNFNNRPMDVTLNLKTGDAPICDVTFDSMGGSPVAKIRVARASTVAKPADPVKTGYQFLGWHTKETYVHLDSASDIAVGDIDYIKYTPWDFNTPVTGHLTLYAQWKPTSEDLDVNKPIDKAVNLPDPPHQTAALPATADRLSLTVVLTMLMVVASTVLIIAGIQIRRRRLR